MSISEIPSGTPFSPSSELQSRANEARMYFQLHSLLAVGQRAEGRLGAMELLERVGEPPKGLDG